MLARAVTLEAVNARPGNIFAGTDVRAIDPSKHAGSLANHVGRPREAVSRALVVSVSHLVSIGQRLCAGAAIAGTKGFAADCMFMVDAPHIEGSGGFCGLQAKMLRS